MKVKLKVNIGFAKTSNNIAKLLMGWKIKK